MCVAWFRLEDLGALMRAHRSDDSITRVVSRMLRADLIVIDSIRLSRGVLVCRKGHCPTTVKGTTTAHDGASDRSLKLTLFSAFSVRRAGGLLPCPLSRIRSSFFSLANVLDA
jgi:hypothetical protein